MILIGKAPREFSELPLFHLREKLFVTTEKGRGPDPQDPQLRPVVSDPRDSLIARLFLQERSILDF